MQFFARVMLCLCSVKLSERVFFDTVTSEENPRTINLTFLSLQIHFCSEKNFLPSDRPPRPLLLTLTRRQLNEECSSEPSFMIGIPFNLNDSKEENWIFWEDDDFPNFFLLPGIFSHLPHLSSSFSIFVNCFLPLILNYDINFRILQC